MTAAKDRPGRPAGGTHGNRDLILDVARRCFAAQGFAGTTMRSIAAEANVDVALVAHYFGSKDKLFTETMQLPAQAHERIVQALSSPAPERGAILTRAYLDLWEDEQVGAQMRVLGRSALTNKEAGERMRSLLAGKLASDEMAALVSGNAPAFALAMTHLLGVAVARYLLQVPAVAQLPREELIARVAPAVQLHLDS